ncbi:Alpha/Beta hydrolase protein [Amylocarpus encephaloides]|uniref:Alpha/Beta hydrolase protein n=1 Tax=Amylocarpus encephaloides TaxID=45428 RepID=A0A9P8CA14_9HELO|nr:Alpha/Beta hydrolase protein [Amylocarpus encephaloides]
MAPIPFLGRLNIAEYLALVGSFLLVGLEAIIRILTLALPTSIINLFYRASRRSYNKFTSPSARKLDHKREDISSSIRNASDFVEICALNGYYAEEHVVKTGDGYLLGVHRLAWRRGEEEERVNSGPKSVRKNVVYLHHGLLMNSEVWVCLTDEKRCLPFKLVEKGYDVWLGNNRGNKYSKKSIHHSPTEIPFWDFSMDEFALHDIPDTIHYILETTSAPSLSYIGFSQGTAQAFATLAVHPKLNDQVNVFIALAPAMSPAGLSNGIVDALVKASPQVLFLLFGRRSILSSANMWQAILFPPIFVRAIDMGLSFLFGWHARNISTSQKLAAYSHLYSFTSTKSVVHWFQIIRTKSFQMYDDDVQPVLSLGSTSKYTKVAKFPTRNIKTPIVLVYGGSDSLVDIDVMMKELPAHTIANEIPHFEHLDFLWAREVDTLVFPHVFDALESFVDAEHTKEEYDHYRSARHLSLYATNMPALTYQSEDDSSQHGSYVDVAAAATTPECGANSLIPIRNPQPSGPPSLSDGSRKRVHVQHVVDHDDSSESSPHSPVTLTMANGNGNLTHKLRQARSSSVGSQISFQEKNGRGHGIILGAARAVSGVVSGEVKGGMAGGSGSGDDVGGGGRRRKGK